MAKIFVSHRTADLDLAERLAKRIAHAGHVVWLDAWNVAVGDSLIEEIGTGLADADCVVLCCSFSGTAAPWTSREWMSTLARELNGHGVKLLCVLLPGGEPPTILADHKYADVRSDFDAGVADLLAAISRA